MPTLGTVWDRVSSLVAAQGYVRATNPFDFDQQPETKLDKVYCQSSTRRTTEGYLGGDQGETHEFEIYLAQKTARDPWGAVRQLKADMDLVEQAVAGDDAAFDYHLLDDGVSSDCRAPTQTANFAVGQLKLAVAFDRIMP